MIFKPAPEFRRIKIYSIEYSYSIIGWLYHDDFMTFIETSTHFPYYIKVLSRLGIGNVLKSSIIEI